jgi:16S rRNA (cytosine1402-N4)-methyltransferase
MKRAALTRQMRLEHAATTGSDYSAHRPVMLSEALQGLRLLPGGCYVDGTFGRGGHSAAILQGLTQGSLHVFDRDAEAIAAAEMLRVRDPRVQPHHANFAELGCLGAESADGILLDLGVSSPQLDVAERGFSFMRDGPLDMRMDQSREPSAARYLADAGEAELLRVLREYGEEPQAKKIAAALVAARGTLHRTHDLAALVANVKGQGKPGRHPATQVFQAIRMAVNAELSALADGLLAAMQVMKVGARLAVISFHSLEDRMVKEFFHVRAKAPSASRRDFMAQSAFRPSLRLISKDRASKAECDANPRARSAVLRVVEKLDISQHFTAPAFATALRSERQMEITQ